MYALARITKYMNKVISCVCFTWFELFIVNILVELLKKYGVFNISMHDLVE